MTINPFRCRRGDWKASPSLMHAILALSGHRLNVPGRDSHQQAAIHSLRQSLESPCSRNSYETIRLLDTFVLLFSLDETSSALGTWSMHLSGAYSVLEASGGIQSWTRSRRTIAQVAMLTWWDTIIALVSRQGCIFPYKYFEVVLQHGDDTHWTLLGLCGCPKDLAIGAVQLAHLAAEKEQTSKMKFTTFNDTLVKDIQNSLKTWSHPRSSTAWYDNETMQSDIDNLHCSEAWRHGLLLYILRIFSTSQQPSTKTTVEIAQHARQISDHVFACRDVDFLAKQTGFPLFLAGCEIREPSMRRKIADFCSYWAEKTRYFMIGDVMQILEEVWSLQESEGGEGGEGGSWPVVVDRLHGRNSQRMGDLQVTLCFG